MFQRLVTYKKEHKSINVPQTYESDPRLGRWVGWQRHIYRNETLSEYRVNLLDSIGFVWKISQIAPWEEMYQRLVIYKKQHKSTNVPNRYQADPKLGLWVGEQRKIYSKQKLSIDRINHLESIGFVWNIYDAQWMEMYSKVVELKKHNKSIEVRRGYTEDPSLGEWAYTQRRVYNNGDLLKKRYQLLSSIGFVLTAVKKNTSHKR
jgi:hypothetical protein